VNILNNIKDYEAMAKFSLTDAERQQVSEWADMLTGSFQALEAVDAACTEPLVTVLEIRNVLRDDIAPEKTISRDELLSNAPEQYDGYFQVPKTLD